MSNLLGDKVFVALDLETTDLDPKKGEIIEIGALKFKGSKIIEEFQVMVKPEKPIPAFITTITGISDEDVKEALSLSEVKKDLVHFVGGATIVGHNIVFDLNFLKFHGVVFDKNEFLDTWRFATLLLPNLSSYSLEVLAKEFKIKQLESHRALDDAKAAKELLIRLLQEIEHLSPQRLDEILSFLKHRYYPYKDFFVLAKEQGSKKISTSKKKIIKSETKTSLDLDKVDDFFKSEITGQKSSSEISQKNLELAQDISQAIIKSQKQVIEAPSGFDKSLALLLGAILGKKKTVIFFKDYKSQKDLSVRVKRQITKLLGGEPDLFFCDKASNYLCLRRFNNFQKRDQLDVDVVHSLLKVMLWLPVTSSGLLSEINLSFDEKKLKDEICYRDYFCSEEKCSYFEQCYYYKAQKQREESRICLTSQSNLLEFLDFSKSRHIILDDFEFLEEQFEMNLGKSYNLSQIDEKIASLEASLLDLARREGFEVTSLEERINEFKNQLALFFGLIALFVKNDSRVNFGRLEIRADILDDLDLRGILVAKDKLMGQIQGLNQEILDLEVKTKSLIVDQEGLVQENKRLVTFFERFFKLNENFHQEIVLGEKDVYFSITPVFDRFTQVGEALSKTSKARLLLGHNVLDTAIMILKESLHLDGFEEKKLDTPFDLRKQTQTLIVEDFPDERAKSHFLKLRELIEGMVASEKRGVLVILKNKGEVTRFFKEESLNFKEKEAEIFFQTISGGKEKIEEGLRNAKKPIFVTTYYFLRTIDIQKDKFAGVILAKLPFLPPRAGDKKADGNVFVTRSLPRARQAFKEIFDYLLL
ncbi:3'-5' exoribonuclease, partial [Patescibacteria group bacterium]|nr:3'-5' exoribonuclease [Patescibacteria group bacterium]